MMKKLLIRPYHPGDEKEVIQLWQECGLINLQNNPRNDIERKLRVNPEWFLIGSFEGKIVASCMVGYEGHRGWINYLAVSPAYRSNGFATQMMTEAEMRLRVAGCPKIKLQISEANTDVIRFYECIGYTKDPVLSMGKRIDDDEPFSFN